MSDLAILNNIIIVLSHTTEPGNIGSVARAMKTMGFAQWKLINPADPRGRTARSLAHSAEDVLESAEVVENLESAIGEIQVIAGTTSRQRQLRKHALLAPRDLAELLVAHAATEKVALLFGTERTGLTNSELNVCRYMSTIDAAVPQPSLNLAMAVMVYCWEIRQAVLRSRSAERTVRRPELSVQHPHRSTRLPTLFELDAMYAHLAQAMTALGYSEFEQGKFLTYLRQLHMRAGIVDWEMQIYHLLARRILKALSEPKFTGGA